MSNYKIILITTYFVLSDLKYEENNNETAITIHNENITNVSITNVNITIVNITIVSINNVFTLSIYRLGVLRLRACK